MSVDGEPVCNRCNGRDDLVMVEGTAPGGTQWSEHLCELCRTKEQNYDAGYREALERQFNQLADLIEEDGGPDGGLNLIDLVCDRVQAHQRKGEETEDLIAMLRRRRGRGDGGI